jgi:pimeloyl-ACP methyl ester carboxylesterase
LLPAFFTLPGNRFAPSIRQGILARLDDEERLMVRGGAQNRANGPRKGERRRRWPFYLLSVMGMLAGVAVWAYSPSLPREMLIARYTNAESEFIDVGGARAHVRDQGNPDGIPVLLIHGASGSLHVWEGWARALGGQARLISVDLPGHGLTGAWPRGEYTVEAYADFIELLASTLNLDRFVLAGHSLGGGVAWTFAARRPDRVSQLILVDSAGYPPDDGKLRWPTRLARLPLVGDIGIYFKPELWVRHTLIQAYGDPAMLASGAVERTAELQRFPGNREATLQRARAQGLLDPTPLKRLDVPTLILWGGKDPWLPVADAFRFQNDIKGAKLVIFAKLGHDLIEENAKASAAAVAAFLQPTPARPAPPPESSATDSAVHSSVLPKND